MVALTETATQTSAAVLEPSGVHSRHLNDAIKEVVGVLSKGQSHSDLVYAVVVFDKKHHKTAPEYLATASTFFRAYLRGRRALLYLSEVILTHPDRDHLQSFEHKSFSDVRFFWGQASLRDIREKVRPTPGVFIIPQHLGTSLLERLRLPPLPETVRDMPLVIQVDDTELSTDEETSSPTWSGWDDREDIAPLINTVEPAIGKDTLAWRKQFMSENECWTAAKVAEESTSRAANRAAIASRWAAEKKIFSVRFEGQHWYPRFQFQDGSPITAVAQVISQFPDHATGWELAYFFVTPNPNIGGRKPTQLLNNDPSRLASLAQAFAHPADVF